MLPPNHPLRRTRTARRLSVAHDYPVQAGESVLALIGNPNRFDIHRASAKDHLSLVGWPGEAKTSPPSSSCRRTI